MRGSCFDVVPLATRLWNPEIAPHATVTMSIGHIQPPRAEKATTPGAFISGWVRIRPRKPKNMPKYSTAPAK